MVPCYNVERTIDSVVEGVLQFADKVIVVDNNSTDGTSVVARLAGANICYCSKKGMGIATSIGIAKALECRPCYIVTLDGDGQHDPFEIPKLLRNLQNSNSDIAVGIRVGMRMGNSPMPTYRKFGNNVITLAFNFGAKFKLPDAQCGFRVFTSDVARIIETKEPGFGCITEFLIRARKRRCRIIGVPITCIYHNNLKDNSVMNPITHGLGVLFSTIRWRIWEVTRR